MSSKWICDTGASQHMCGNISIFINLRPSIYIRRVLIPNGSFFTVKQIGDIIISPTITLKDVYYVPDFKLNLISLYRLIVDMDILK